MILSSTELAKELAELGIFPDMNDGRYYCPTKEWLEEFMSWFWKSNPYRYKKEKFDCDNFAKRAWVNADESLQENFDIQDCDHTFSFCRLNVKKGLNGIVSGYHATNICRCSDGKWYFAEPQTAQIHEVKTAIDSGLCDIPFSHWM